MLLRRLCTGIVLIWVTILAVVDSFYHNHRPRHAVPNNWGYKTEYHQPRSYVYHEQYFPRISKSFYEADHYNHYPNRVHHYQDNYRPIKHVITTYKTIPQPYKPVEKKDEHDSIKINFEIPMKKIFEKGLEKEIDENLMKGGHGEEIEEKKEQGYGGESGGALGGLIGMGGGGEGNGYGEKQEEKKDFDIQIPKFDVDGMLEKIKEKI